MINVYSAEEIRRIEREAFANGETEDGLIERAASGLHDFAKTLAYDTAVIFAGTGNNGSDALSLADLLLRDGKKVRTYLFGNTPNEYVGKRVELLRAKGADIAEIQSAGDIKINKTDFVIDGLLGIGLSREVTGLLWDVIEKINRSGAKILAVDIPSGLNADTGRVMGIAVKADYTVTFTAYKQGLILADGRNYAGEITVQDIGLKLPSPHVGITEAGDIKLPKRAPVSNKGTYGNVKIIAGSPTMMGASLLAHESALAALRSGTGYAVLCVPRSLMGVYRTRVKEELLCAMPDAAGKIIFDKPTLDGIIQKASSIVIGMGLGDNSEVIKIIEYLAHNFTGTLVIDGDGLNALSKDLSAVKDHTCKLILTPHVAEFMRLSKDDGTSPDTGRTAALAKKLNAVIAMKSATTVISDGERTMLNTTGTPAMAKAGSGDVLGGMVGAFAATSDDPFTAALRACYEFGKAGERAAEERGETSVLASDIIVSL